MFMNTKAPWRMGGQLNCPCWGRRPHLRPRLPGIKFYSRAHRVTGSQGHRVTGQGSPGRGVGRGLHNLLCSGKGRGTGLACYVQMYCEGYGGYATPPADSPSVPSIAFCMLSADCASALRPRRSVLRRRKYHSSLWRATLSCTPLSVTLTDMTRIR